MIRVLLITTAAWVATITSMIYMRGGLAFGGEMIIPALVSAYAVITEGAKE